MSQNSPGVLSQDFELGFTYTRSTGPVVGRFLTALKNRQVVGNRGSDGKVYAPPAELSEAEQAALRFDELVTEAIGDYEQLLH